MRICWGRKLSAYRNAQMKVFPEDVTNVPYALRVLVCPHHAVLLSFCSGFLVPAGWQFFNFS